MDKDALQREQPFLFTDNKVPYQCYTSGYEIYIRACAGVRLATVGVFLGREHSRITASYLKRLTNAAFGRLQAFFRLKHVHAI